MTDEILEAARAMAAQLSVVQGSGGGAEALGDVGGRFPKPRRLLLGSGVVEVGTVTRG